jgi:hypothetical protein
MFSRAQISNSTTQIWFASCVMQARIVVDHCRIVASVTGCQVLADFVAAQATACAATPSSGVAGTADPTATAQANAAIASA